MKKFILLIALSVLLYSAPGHTGTKGAGTQTGTAPRKEKYSDHMRELLEAQDGKWQKANAALELVSEDYKRAKENHQDWLDECNKMFYEQWVVQQDYNRTETRVNRRKEEYEQAKNKFDLEQTKWDKMQEQFRQQETKSEQAEYEQAEYEQAKEESMRQQNILKKTISIFNERKAELDQVTERRAQAQANCDSDTPIWDKVKKEYDQAKEEADQAFGEAQEEVMRKQFEVTPPKYFGRGWTQEAGTDTEAAE